MIAYVRGILEYKSPSYIFVDVEGVGYKVQIPLSTYDKLPGLGKEVKIYTYLHSREDTILLYGFLTLEEHELFELLLTVSDIGPKSATSILSGTDVNKFKDAISRKNTSLLTSIPGIGKKTAQRLIIELQDKISHILPTGRVKSLENVNEKDMNDAIEALAKLDFKKASIHQAMNKVLENTKGQLPVERLIKETLKYLYDPN